jgi:hypothetical protein
MYPHAHISKTAAASLYSDTLTFKVHAVYTKYKEQQQQQQQNNVCIALFCTLTLFVTMHIISISLYVVVVCDDPPINDAIV